MLIQFALYEKRFVVVVLSLFKNMNFMFSVTFFFYYILFHLLDKVYLYFRVGLLLVGGGAFSLLIWVGAAFFSSSWGSAAVPSFFRLEMKSN